VDFVKLVGNLAELFRLLLIEVRLVVFIGIISLDDHASAHQEAVFIVCCLALHWILLELLLAPSVDVLHLAIDQIEDLRVHDLDYNVEHINYVLLPVLFLAFNDVVIGLEVLHELFSFALLQLLIEEILVDA
jgi:hypothetical protein